jgi:hypothetical protein
MKRKKDSYLAFPALAYFVHHLHPWQRGGVGTAAGIRQAGVGVDAGLCVTSSELM